MLKLPQKYTNDEKANGIIAQYLNGNILKLVKDEIADYEDIREKEAREDDPAFCRAVSMFFPEHYPFEKMGKVFLGLQALLESEYEFVPELAMEYVMYSLVQARIEAADGLGIKTLTQDAYYIIPLSRNREFKISGTRAENLCCPRNG